MHVNPEVYSCKKFVQEKGKLRICLVACLCVLSILVINWSDWVGLDNWDDWED